MTPFFLDGTCGKLFAIDHRPAGRAETGVVFLPSGFEENNRSRHMAARQARDFQASGLECVLLDYYGTGDSDGEYEHARIATWLDDIVIAADWLRRRGCTTVVLWGLRLGGLIAVHAAGKARADGLILWAPATQGGRFLDQWLRVAVAGGIDRDGQRTTVRDLRARLVGGDAIEVGGYDISPQFAAELDQLTLKNLPPPACPVDWIDVTGNAEPNFASRTISDGWRAAGGDVALSAVTGAPFWSLMEPEWAPRLIAATHALAAARYRCTPSRPDPATGSAARAPGGEAGPS